MTSRMGVHLIQADSLMEYHLEDELTVYDATSDVVHILNPTAAEVWRLCDGTNAVDEIVSMLAQTYDLNPEDVEADVLEVIEQLCQAQLLSGCQESKSATNDHK